MIGPNAGLGIAAPAGAASPARQSRASTAVSALRRVDRTGPRAIRGRSTRRAPFGWYGCAERPVVLGSSSSGWSNRGQIPPAGVAVLAAGRPVDHHRARRAASDGEDDLAEDLALVQPGEAAPRVGERHRLVDERAHAGHRAEPDEL